MPRTTAASTPTEESTSASGTTTLEGSTTGPSSSSTTTADSSAPSSSSSSTEEETPTPPDPDDQADDQADGEAGEDLPSRQAAKYRRRLRETEAERDQLAEEVTELRGRLERFHSGKLTEAVGGRVNLAALRGLGADLAGIIREDGTVDGERARAVLTEHEISPKPGGYVPLSGTGDHGPAGDGPTWSDAISSRRK